MAEHRGFHKLAAYQEGRKARGSRDARAMAKRGRHGRRMQETEWTNAEVTALYRLAKVFVFPSLYEGFGLPPLEAMASGTPVVTSNVSSLPEVAGDAAVLVDPYDPTAIADGIERVLTDEDLRHELRVKGLARAKQFSWEDSVRRVREIYDEASR